MLHTNFLFRSIFLGGGRQKFPAPRRQNPKSASAHWTGTAGRLVKVCVRTIFVDMELSPLCEKYGDL